MKRRTRIARWVFVVAAFLPPTYFTIPVIVGWWFVVRRRAWAWWGLIGVCLAQGIYLTITGPQQRHPVHLPWYAHLVYGAVPVIAVLWILLTDRPSQWKSADVPVEPIGRTLKRRTRVFAWLAVVTTGVGFLFVMSMLAIPYGKWFNGPGIPFAAFAALGIFPVCFWAALLYERSWGWKGSVVWTSLLSLQGTGSLVYPPIGMIMFKPTHAKPHSLLAAGIVSIVWELIILLVLLTDRPSGWRNRMPEPAPPPKPKTGKEWAAGKKRKHKG